MDEIALYIIDQYIKERLPNAEFDLFIVWKAKALQNWKYLISSTLQDGMYYELTFNGNKQEWYLDAYQKVENRVVKNPV